MKIVANRWVCEECGGRVELVNFEATDASAVESYRCVECGNRGEYEAAHGPQYPKKRGIEER